MPGNADSARAKRSAAGHTTQQSDGTQSTEQHIGVTVQGRNTRHNADMHNATTTATELLSFCLPMLVLLPALMHWVHLLQAAAAAARVRWIEVQ